MFALEAIEIDADVVEELLASLVIAEGRLDVQRAAVHHQRLAVVTEFVALGVTAEIVVVVEDQNLRASPDVLEK